MTVEDAFAVLRSLPKEWGASAQQVADVEARLAVRLPPPLRELMLCTGSRGHMRWLFPDEEIAPLVELPELKEFADEMLNEEDSALRPLFPFVVLSEHQGYLFTFIRADGLDADPEVFSYEEGRGVQPRLVRQSIRQRIAAAVQRAVGTAQ